MSGIRSRRRRLAWCMRQRAVARGITAALVVALGYQLYVPLALAAEPVAPVAADIHTTGPEPRVYHITPEQFETLDPLLQAHGFQRLTNAAAPTAAAAVAGDSGQTLTNAVSSAFPVAEPQAPAVDPPMEQPASVGGSVGGGQGLSLPVDDGMAMPSREPVSTGPQYCGDGDDAADFVGNLIVELLDSDWTSGDAAVVIFVVIGVTVVLTVVVYAGVYLYEIVTGTGDYRHWWQIEPRFESVSGGSSSGQLAGVKLSAGFEREDMRTGLVLESGYMNLRIRPEGSDLRVRAEGAYLMAGAGIQWLFGHPRNPSSLGFELLAGAADDPDVDIISVARANLGFGIGAYGRLGLSVGSLLVGLDPEDGLLEHHNQFIPLIGLETGFRF